jgi:hypothetical protein
VGSVGRLAIHGLRALAAAGFVACAGIQTAALAGIGAPEPLAKTCAVLLITNIFLLLAAITAAPWTTYKVWGFFYHGGVDLPEMARRSARWVRWGLVLSCAYCVLFLLTLVLFPALRIFPVGFPALLVPQFALDFLIFNGMLAPAPKRKKRRSESWWDDWLDAWRSD